MVRGGTDNTGGAPNWDEWGALPTIGEVEADLRATKQYTKEYCRWLERKQKVTEDRVASIERKVKRVIILGSSILLGALVGSAFFSGGPKRLN